MSLFRSNPSSASRLRPASTLVALGTVLLAGSVLTACSSGSPVEPTAPSRLAAPTDLNRNGFQTSWGVTGGNGGDASTQSATALTPTAKDSTKAKTK